MKSHLAMACCGCESSRWPRLSTLWTPRTNPIHASEKSLIARKPVDPPRFIEKVEAEWNKKELGLAFKKGAPVIQKVVADLPTEELERIGAATEEKQVLLGYFYLFDLTAPQPIPAQCW